MKSLELYAKIRELEQAGWEWETWSGSIAKGTAKGWWVLPEAKDIRGMRRGDPKPFDQATITTLELYQ